MSIRKLLVFLFLTFILSESHAWVYVDTPEPYKQFPNPIECNIQSRDFGYDRVDCFAYGTMPGKFNVLTAEDDGSDLQVTEFSSVEHIRCQDGYCRHPDNDAFLGRFGLDGQPYTTVEVPFGYYITANPNGGKPLAYQYGTGPMADTISRPWIAEEAGEFPMGQPYQGQGQVASNNNSRWSETYDLWCNPRGEYCMGEGDAKYTREELPDHYPIVNVSSENGSDYYCSLETCHRKSDDEVIGLNPSYHLWD